jgi:hypothetical protein
MDMNTFVTTLYVHVDDFVRTDIASELRVDPSTQSLTESEIITLSLLAHAPRFRGESDFYRFADHWLRPFFPRLPARSQFNRLVRRHGHLIVLYMQHLAQQLQRPTDLYEILDASAIPIRNVNRRGRSWLAGQAAKGHSGRLGWFYGFQVLLSATPAGVVNGFGLAPGNVKDQNLATTFLAARAQQHPRMASVGKATGLPSVTDRGFSGKDNHRLWSALTGEQIITPPQSQHKIKWPVALHRWVASIRQIIETVFGRVHDVFGLHHERPHTLDGFYARFSATLALSNFCIWLNRLTGRPDLEYVNCFAW